SHPLRHHTLPSPALRSPHPPPPNASAATPILANASTARAPAANLILGNASTARAPARVATAASSEQRIPGPAWYRFAHGQNQAHSRSLGQRHDERGRRHEGWSASISADTK